MATLSEKAQKAASIEYKETLKVLKFLDVWFKKHPKEQKLTAIELKKQNATFKKEMNIFLRKGKFSEATKKLFIVK